jgi:hypothetical protein
MLDRLSVRGLALLIGTLALLLLGTAYIALGGSALVVDESGAVERAFITTTDGRKQRLYRLWSGYFFAIPQQAGGIEVQCRDGSRKEWGYVTVFVDTKIKVTGNGACERIVEVP